MYFVLILLMLNGVIGVDKIWYPNVWYNNNENWLPNRIPCEYDKIIFESDIGASIILPINTSFKEALLPQDGELVLPYTGDLTIYDKKIFTKTHSNCSGQDKAFLIKGTKWLDGDNWRFTGLNGEEDMSEGVNNSPIPHMERVPCDTDSILFDIQSITSFQVKMPDFPVNIGILIIRNSDEDIIISSTNDFKNKFLIDSTTVYYLFQGNLDNLRITGNICEDPLGCICINTDDYFSTYHDICSTEIQKQKCNIQLSCENPIEPYGHCCRICGAIVYLDMDLKKYDRQKILELIHVDKDSNVFTHLSRYDYDKAQIIITEDGLYRGQSVLAANKIVNILKNDKSYGIKNFNYVNSGDPNGSLIATPGDMIVLFILIIVAILVAYLVIYAVEKYRAGDPIVSASIIEIPSFHFRRFSNRSKSDIDVKDIEIIKSFDNPMFDRNKPDQASGGSKIEFGSVIKKSGDTTQIENPTFKALQAKEGNLIDVDDDDDTISFTDDDFAASLDKYASLKEEE